MTMTEQEIVSLKSLNAKRGVIKSSVTRIKTFVEKFDPKTDNVFQLKARLSKLEAAFKDFETTQLDIFKLDNSAKQTKESEDFEIVYYDAYASIMATIEQMEASKSGPSSEINSISNQNRSSNVTLPRLNLPIFEGHYSNWISFRDTYKALIHDTDVYSDIEKFHYLRSCLKGDAFQTIDTISLSAVNYSTAWDVLKTRYENKRLIVQEHILKIINSPQITKTSHAAMRRLVDDVTINIAALKNLEQPTKHWDALLLPIITSKFDFVTKRDWEESLTVEIPKYDDLVKFLEKKCLLLESLQASNQKPGASGNQISSSSKNQHLSKSATTHVAVNDTKNTSCFLCKKSHSLYRCPDFLSLSVSDRVKKVTSLKLCSNCFRNNHKVDACQSSFCRHCNLKHNTLLHLHNADQAESGVIMTSRDLNSGKVLLSTAQILVKNSLGTYQLCRCLLDSGSQLSMITEAACRRLGLSISKANVLVTGINNSQSQVKGSANLVFKSLYDETACFSVNCFVLPKVTQNLPFRTFQVKIPQGLSLADPTFQVSSPIDILLGAEVFWDLIRSKATKLANNLHLQETALGYIVGGNITSNNSQEGGITCHLAVNSSLEEQMNRFWELDTFKELTRTDPLSPEERLCEQHYVNTIKRDTLDGRFVVQLPFKPDPPILGESKTQAIKQFYSLERKLNKNPDLKTSYVQFMREYQSLGHMTNITHTESNVNNQVENCFYLPHHAVIKETSATTKLRVVFNASAVSSSGYSLNDTLLVGPTIQEELFTILIRFRTYKYAFTADIVKMYRQIWVAAENRDYQRILWRDDMHNPVQTFTLNTVTYGTRSAPFLAIRSLHQLAFEESDNFPSACETIIRDFYVDDILSGGQDLSETIKLKNDLIHVLSKGKFTLQKWASNDKRLTDVGIDSLRDIDLNKQDATRILGLLWGVEQDVLKYSIINFQVGANTKRGVLSTISQLFDPLGLLGPVMISAKILMQKLWALKLSWDEPLPESQRKIWQEFANQLSYVNKIHIDRKIIDTSCNIHNNVYELHGFCDASKSGYGACIYLRTKNENGLFSVNLICAKSRVAPLKTITIPRLELCGAVLLSNLLTKVKNHINLPIQQCYYWTDSTIVLSWLKGNAVDWKVFVAHRVSEIQSLTDINQWHHVTSNNNPADILSRGITPAKLLNATIWWHGPPYLLSEHLPLLDTFIQNQDIPERKIVMVTVNVPELPVFTRFSSFVKLQRVIGYCLRFINNCRNQPSNKSNHLSCKELRDSTIIIIRYIQRREFATEYCNLRSGAAMTNNSSLQPLKPFMDENLLIRVGGRLRHAPISYQQKFPIILPKHHVTQLLIKLEHERQLHSGPTGTLCALRQKYWPLSARNQIRKIIHQCIPCFRAKPRNANPIMGDLPPNRFNTTRPFYNCGIDYLGPISVKEGFKRSRRTFKTYVALFVCFATKAIHLELVGDLTTDCFLNALKRFISRRGIVKNIYSDNAANFVGAQRELSSLAELFKSQSFQDNVIDSLSISDIKWHFIPARAPHFGGIWEAGVKSVKYHLRRVLGNSLITYEEMYTLLSCIEACLNSRPLCQLTNDPNDIDALTPGHFLIGRPLTAPAEPSILHLQQNRLSRWQYIEQLRQHFWARWSKEYLGQLQGRSRWRTSSDKAIQPGALVVLKEDNLPPLMWRLARITELHPGADGVVRVVTVKTSSGFTKRAVRNICLLPVE